LKDEPGGRSNQLFLKKHDYAERMNTLL
jgi:hypothetical protein